jgi:hypothetical protein
MQNDPVSVQVVRIFTILKSDDDAIRRFFQRLFAPKPEKIRTTNPDLEQRIAKQQALIQFMQDELSDLQQAHLSKLENLKKAGKSKKTQDEVTLSKNTTVAYEDFVKQAAVDLIQNSDAVIEGRKKRNAKNIAGLRAAVAKLTKSDLETSDQELADRLAKLAHAEELDEAY